MAKKKSTRPRPASNGMKGDFLGAFVGNPARARLVRVFIFSQSETFTLSQAAKRAAASPKVALKEIKALEQIGIIKTAKSAGKENVKTARKTKKKKKASKKTFKFEAVWLLNLDFKHLRALSSFVHEVSPMQHGNILSALKGSGRLSAVVLSGCFVGDTTRPVDLIVAADNLNENRLEYAIKTFEPLFGREIRYSAFSTSEFRYRLTLQDRLIRDTLDYPHLVLLDRTRLL